MPKKAATRPQAPTLTPAAVEELIVNKKKELRAAEYELFKLTHVPKDREKEKADRAAGKKAKYKTKNGLTIHRLRQCGHKVMVSHIRYVSKTAQNKDGSGTHEILTPCPSSLRKFTEFYPRGGQTWVHITTIDDKTIVADSTCHIEDSFDYKLGVKFCLEAIPPDIAEDLLAPLELIEAAEGADQTEPAEATA